MIFESNVWTLFGTDFEVISLQSKTTFDDLFEDLPKFGDIRLFNICFNHYFYHWFCGLEAEEEMVFVLIKDILATIQWFNCLSRSHITLRLLRVESQNHLFWKMINCIEVI